MAEYRKTIIQKILFFTMKKVISTANLFVNKVKETGIRVDKAFLFGSHANTKNKPKVYSDIDICIVSPNLGRDFIEETVRLNKISSQVDSRIEAIPFDPERLNDPYDPLAFEIRTYGIVLS